MSYDLGSAVALEATVRDDAGALTTAATATLEIVLPDGTTTLLEVAEPTEPGTYRVSYTPTQAGLHSVRWVFTGPDRAHSDVFSARPAHYPQIISLADAKEHLNKKSGVDDVELRLMIVAATAIVESKIGPVVRRTFTQTHQGGSAVALHKTPVLEVVSIADADRATEHDVADSTFDADSGVLWDLPRGRLTITYVAGRPVVPAAVELATGIIVKHLWQTQRGHSARPGMLGQEMPTTEEQAIAYYSGFALPSRAAELLASVDAMTEGIA